MFFTVIARSTSDEAISIPFYDFRDMAAKEVKARSLGLEFWKKLTFQLTLGNR